MRLFVYFAPLLLAGAAIAQDTTKPAEQQATKPAAAQDTTKPAATADKPAATTDKPAELKTQGYKGTLSDASCAGGAASTPAATADRSTNPPSPAAGAACAVTASTTMFALKTSDGKTLVFDSVGNVRAQQALKEKKKWNDAVTAGKTINVKVEGVVSGEKLTVMSIN